MRAPKRPTSGTDFARSRPRRAALDTAEPAHARDLALALAMSVEVRLGTEDHSPLSYLAKPLTDYFARSMREE